MCGAVLVRLVSSGRWKGGTGPHILSITLPCSPQSSFPAPLPQRCKSYRPVSVAVIHHPIHHECGADDLNQEEEEEEEEESKPPIPTQVGPTPTDSPTDTGMSMITGAPDSAAPITIWRSESPTGKSQGNRVIKKIKKKKEKDKEEETDEKEKAKVKKKVKKGKLMKKKSPVKSESPRT